MSCALNTILHAIEACEVQGCPLYVAVCENTRCVKVGIGKRVGRDYIEPVNVEAVLWTASALRKSDCGVRLGWEERLTPDGDYIRLLTLRY